MIPMSEPLRPVPGDPDGPLVMAMFDVSAENWVLSTAGDYQAAACETMRYDGSGYQRVVALEWPGRINHTTENVTVRLLMSPEDALGLADVMSHAARWLIAARELGR
jgi:hypothetical protein